MPTTTTRLEPGTVVVPKVETRLKGADAFTRLVVIAVGKKRGGLTVARLNGGGVWTGVHPDSVTVVEL